MEELPLFPLDEYISTVKVEPKQQDMLTIFLGEEGAARVVAEFGGLSLFIPTTHSGDVFKKFVDQLGQELAEKLIAVFGGEELYIPRRSSSEVRVRHFRIKQRYNELLKTGKPARRVRQICAKEFGTTDRHVLRIVSGEYSR